MVDTRPRVVLIAHGYLSGAAALPLVPAIAATSGGTLNADPFLPVPVAASLLAAFAGLWTIFAQRSDLRPIAPLGLLLTWHPLAGGIDPAPRLFSLHLPAGRHPSPPIREGRARRTTWKKAMRTLPPLPSAPDGPPTHFALLCVLDGALDARVSSSIPLTPDGRINPRMMVLPPERWPAALPTTRLRLLPRPVTRPAVRHHLVDPFRDGWALLPSGPVPQAVIAALQDATTGARWIIDPNGQPVHTVRRRHTLVRTRLSVSPPGGQDTAGSLDLAAYLTVPGLSFDLVADLLLILLLHAQDAGPQTPHVWATAEGMLDARGLNRVRKREGTLVRDAGHRVEDIAAVSASLQLLTSLRVAATITGATEAAIGLSPLLIVHEAQERARPDGLAVQVAWRYTLGPWFGALTGGREPAALFPRCALSYDPYRQRQAKRLARYLTFHFRMDAGHDRPLDRAIGPLLQECALSPDHRNPERTRQSLERAADRLQADGLLQCWRVSTGAPLPARGWLPLWLRDRLLLTPSPHLQERYAHLRRQP